MIECDNINRYIRTVLMVGMLLSVAMLIVGLIMYALTNGSWEPVPLSLGAIVSGIAQGNPIAVIDLGILLLIATPLTRVIATMVLFGLNREMRFVGVALVVLAVVGLAILVVG